MLTLFHSPKSRSSRMLWLLEEIGAPYEVRYVSIPRRDAPDALPDPANPHPDKKVPCLQHDGAVIFESAAIALYLTDAFPEAGIGASVGDTLRASYVSWLFYYGGVIEPNMVVQFSGLAAQTGPGGWGRPDTMNRLISEAVERGPYLLGERFTAVDILIGSMGAWAREMLPPGAAMDAYLQRLSQRPALARSFVRDSPPA